MAWSFSQRYRMTRILSRVHKHLYRLSRGRLLRRAGRADFLLLTTTGRISGRSRTVPLLYLAVHDNFAVIASYGGNPKAPAWLLNLKSDPNVTIQMGSVRISGVSRIATAEERALLWGSFLKAFDGYDRYQARTTRRIPIVIVEPTPALGPC